MTPVKTEGKPLYRPSLTDDPLKVEKGFAHFNRNGEKDFVCRLLAYAFTDSVLRFEAETFRGKRAEICVAFISETAFRLQFFPLRRPERLNAVFEFRPFSAAAVRLDEDFIRFETVRTSLLFRLCPWEMTIVLDAEELTREQIKDHNVDQKYKAVPLGFTTDRYVTRETYDALSIPQRQEALMQGVLLEEEGLESLRERNLQAQSAHADAGGIREAELSFTSEEVPFLTEEEEGIEISRKEDGSVQVTVLDTEACLHLRSENMFWRILTCTSLREAGRQTGSPEG